MKELEALKALCEAATPGPWFTPSSLRLVGSVSAMISGRDCQVASIDGQAAMFDHRASAAEIQRANAAFIAAANPTVVAHLVAVVEAADEFRASLGEHPGRVSSQLQSLVAAIEAMRKEVG